MDPNSLLIGIVAGLVGGGYFAWGRKHSRVVPLLSGVALMLYPYFIDATWLLLFIGAALCAAPFVIRDQNPA
jgi:hypothetical protein